MSATIQQIDTPEPVKADDCSVYLIKQPMMDTRVSSQTPSSSVNLHHSLPFYSAERTFQLSESASEDAQSAAVAEMAPKFICVLLLRTP